MGQILIGRYARELNLDVIHDPTGVSPLAFTRSPTVTVTTVHDVFAWSIPGYSSFLDNLIYKHWLNQRNARTDATITVSNQSCTDIMQYLRTQPERMHIIPYGVSNLFQPLAAELVEPIVRGRFNIRMPYVLYVGSLTERKNLIRLLRAFAKIQHRCPDYLLVLAGPRSWKQSPIESAVKELNLSERVQLTGPVTDHELPALYNGASLFAFPSLYEGFGLPVLEAMACGTPVVTSNTSSLPEVAGDAAILVDPTNVEQIAEAMWLVLSQPALAAALREKGLARAAQFTWERTARETAAVYSRALESSG
jgi:glycosyltransferase involved in cell wall biosynthesis